MVQQIAQAQAQPLLPCRAVVEADLHGGDGHLGLEDHGLVLGLLGACRGRQTGTDAVGHGVLELQVVEIVAAVAREGPAHIGRRGIGEVHVEGHAGGQQGATAGLGLERLEELDAELGDDGRVGIGQTGVVHRVGAGAQGDGGDAASGGELGVADGAGADHHAAHVLAFVGARQHQVGGLVPARRGEHVEAVHGGHHRGAVDVVKVTAGVAGLGEGAHGRCSDGRRAIVAATLGLDLGLVVVGNDGGGAVHHNGRAAAALARARYRDDHVVAVGLEGIVERLDVAGQTVVVGQEDVQGEGRAHAHGQGDGGGEAAFHGWNPGVAKKDAPAGGANVDRQ